MALLKIIIQNDDGSENLVLTQEISVEFERDLNIYTFNKMINARVKGVNVQDLTQTPKNKFTDRIGG